MLAGTARGLSTESSSMLLILSISTCQPTSTVQDRMWLHARWGMSRIIKPSHHLFRLLILFIVVFMLPVSSLEVEIDSDSHRIFHDLND